MSIVNSSIPLIIGFKNPPIAEIIHYIPLFNFYKKSTAVFEGDDKGYAFSKLLDGICDCEFSSDPPSKEVTLKKFGGRPEEMTNRTDRHDIISILAAFGVNHTDYIPRLVFQDDEIEWAKKYLARYKNPIAIHPSTAQWRRHDNFPARKRMLRIENWKWLIGRLRKKYTVIQFGAPEDLSLSFGVHQELNLSVRQMAACYHVIGNILTIDSGGGHQLGIASGANIICYHPYDNYDYQYKKFHFIPKMWDYESPRIQYFLFNDYQTSLNGLL